MSLHLLNRPIAIILVLALGFAPVTHAVAPPALNFKSDQHQRMVVLQQQIDALKAQPAGEAQNLADLRAELDGISASLGGDLPCPDSDGRVQAVSVRSQSAAALPGCAGTTTAFSNTTAVPIADVATTTSTITVSGAGAYLWDVDVTTFIRHTFAADLDITITSPAGTVVTLTTDNGAGNDDVFNGTVWDDSANPGGQVPYVTNNGLVTDHAYVNGVLASPLVPEGALAKFVGENPNGVWTLTIVDDLAGDTGTLDQWALSLTTFATAPTQAPVQSFVQNTPVAIPTGPAVVASNLVVSGLTHAICKISVRTSIPHSFGADLDITLQSPNGTVVTLTTDNGAGNDNIFNGTVWDSSGPPVTDYVFTNLVVAALLSPEESLSLSNTL